MSWGDASLPVRATPLTLRARKCSRHEHREAVARCPSCKAFFCRECVQEHEGQLICAACLTRGAQQRPVRAASVWKSGLQHALSLGAGVTLAWLFFYLLGTVLLSIPADVHEGTFWERGSGEAHGGEE